MRMLCLYDGLLADGRSDVFFAIWLDWMQLCTYGLETFDGLVTKRRMNLRDRVGIGVEKKERRHDEKDLNRLSCK